MESTIELLRNVAALLFWALADLVLSGCWIFIIVGVAYGIIKGIIDVD